MLGGWLSPWKNLAARWERRRAVRTTEQMVTQLKNSAKSSYTMNDDTATTTCEMKSRATKCDVWNDMPMTRSTHYSSQLDSCIATKQLAKQKAT
jgi:hypothetical protein